MSKVKWDFKWNHETGLHDPITYFDATKSYEVTHYRPINMEQGLDFDPAPFFETVLYKEKHGVHTSAPPGSSAYTEFWREQIKRCKEGYEVNGYRITGNHYFFLNFYKLLVVGDEGKASTGRELDHPGFWSKHYEYFHYIEICQYVHKDVCALKARGVNVLPSFKAI